MYSTLDLCIISASNLWTIEDGADVFVMAMLISGADEPTATQSTSLVSAVDDNPTWNFPVQFTIFDLIRKSNNLFVYLQVRCCHQGAHRYEEEVGEVYLPVDDLLRFETHGHSQFFVTYKIRDQSGAPIGELNLSYKFTDDDGDQHRWWAPTPSAPPLPPPPDPPPPQQAARGRAREFPVKVAMALAAAFVAPQMGELLVKLQELVLAAIALVLAFLLFVGFLISLPDLLQRLATQREVCRSNSHAQPAHSGRSRNELKPRYEQI